MPATPRFSYYVSPSALSALGGRGDWQVPLPLNRFGASGTPVRRIDYFAAVRHFLRQNEYARLLGALSRRARREVRPEDLREIQIHLAKHGEFYHPARVVVQLPGQSVSLVLNVAVSAAGRSILHGEYALLKRLGDDRRFLPQVYAAGEAPLPNGAGVLDMFLGEWFEGFCEFHPSRDPSTGRKRFRVWAANTAADYLTPGQTCALFRQAAEILTHFYDVRTFAQIHPWHHAAGDFVLRRRGRSLDVKLVTVRHYAPLVVLENQSREALLTALLLFLLNLTLRMRLDRLDGVGELVWADSRAVSACVDGFWAAVSAKARPPCWTNRSASLSNGFMTPWRQTRCWTWPVNWWRPATRRPRSCRSSAAICGGTWRNCTGS